MRSGNVTEYCVRDFVRQERTSNPLGHARVESDLFDSIVVPAAVVPAPFHHSQAEI